MRICNPHWQTLKQALVERGLDHLGVKTGEEVVAQAVNEIEGRGAENEYNPLMSCNYMIWENALRVGGLAMMNGDLWRRQATARQGRQVGTPTCRGLPCGPAAH
jgi:hypothetical protein